MESFIPSLALVMIAQIPLLLKLWLDYKTKTVALRQELYKHQLETFQTLLSTLIPLHDNLSSVVSTFPDSRIFEGDLQKTAQDIYQFAVKSQLAFHKESIRAELLLPASLSVVVTEYTQGASKILNCAMNLFPNRLSPRPDIELLWRDQEAKFNQALNLMRLSVGIDALSTNVFRDVHADGKATLIQRVSNHSGSMD